MIELEYCGVFELRNAVLRGAQATHVGVNKARHVRYPVATTPWAVLDLDGLEFHIETIGLYRRET